MEPSDAWIRLARALMEETPAFRGELTAAACVACGPFRRIFLILTVQPQCAPRSSNGFIALIKASMEAPFPPCKVHAVYLGLQFFELFYARRFHSLEHRVGVRLEKKARPCRFLSDFVFDLFTGLEYCVTFFRKYV